MPLALRVSFVRVVLTLRVLPNSSIGFGPIRFLVPESVIGRERGRERVLEGRVRGEGERERARVSDRARESVREREREGGARE
jgi:hypothetical protein